MTRNTATVCTDPVILNLWHPIAATAELVAGASYTSQLLGRPISYETAVDGTPTARVTDGRGGPLPATTKLGYVWTSLGEPSGEVFDVVETLEPDRRTLNAISVMVATSAPRAVENFLDMGHFPYVHRDMLGVEPHTEVIDYEAGIEDGEVWARECRFYQPLAAASATGGQMSEYIYRVPHPYCVMLYKNVPTDPSRSDVIGAFLQPMSDERVRAHLFLCLVDETSTDTEIRRFQQTIFSQDKPILENQHPIRLPLDPRIETPIRADRSAITYRRWLTDLGVTYSVIPVAS